MSYALPIGDTDIDELDGQKSADIHILLDEYGIALSLVSHPLAGFDTAASVNRADRLLRQLAFLSELMLKKIQAAQEALDQMALEAADRRDKGRDR